MPLGEDLEIGLPPGTVVGPYEIVGPLGGGGMGEVYRARDARLAREVALKVLPAAFARDRDLMARFENEARSASGLSHPNIVTVFDVGRHGEISYIAMELAPGESLRRVVAGGPLPLRKALHVAAQLADGLAAAHAHGIVHRDLKPENVVLSRQGQAKILDFGLAKLRGAPRGADATLAEAALTMPGTVLGTAGYMSPEQASGAEVDHRSDQFALGAILYELLTGQRAFQRPTAAETMAAVIRSEPEPLASRAPGTPAAVRWLVERCLAKEPGARWESTRDLAADLKALHAHGSELAPPGTAPALPPRPPRRLTAVLAAVAAGALLATLALLSTLRREPPEPPALSPLTSSGHDLNPAVSPDGRTLAYTSVRGGTSRIMLQQLASGTAAELTSGPRDQFPRFFPDGQSLLFTRDEAGRASLYRIPLVGGQARRVLADALAGEPSPDGRRLAFVRRVTGDPRQPAHDVGVADADGGGARILTRLPAIYAVFPRFSPDGRRLALARVRGRRSSAEVIVLDAGSGQEIAAPLPPGGLAFGAPAWAEEGRSLVLAQADGLLLMRLSGGRVRRLVSLLRASTVVETGTSLDLLPEGGLVYESQSGRAHIGLFDLSVPTGYLRPLTSGDAVDRQPTFSPDGKRIVFTSNRSGGQDLWEIAPEGGVPRRLVEDPAEDADPAFTPDGRLLWSNRRGGTYEIWSAEGDATSPRQVSKDGVDAENPVSSGDGRSVIYTSLDPAKIGLWRIRADGGDAERLTSAGGLPEISPDGRTLAYVVFASGDAFIRAVSMDDGRPLPFEIHVRAVVPTRGPILGRCRWRPDGKALAFLGQDASGRTGIFLQDFDPPRDTTSTRRAFAGFDSEASIESFAFSPDGKLLAVSALEIRSQLVAARGIPGLRR